VTPAEIALLETVLAHARALCFGGAGLRARDVPADRRAALAALRSAVVRLDVVRSLRGNGTTFVHLREGES
jgi:hypothetical protein